METKTHEIFDINHSSEKDIASKQNKLTDLGCDKETIDKIFQLEKSFLEQRNLLRKEYNNFTDEIKSDEKDKIDDEYLSRLEINLLDHIKNISDVIGVDLCYKLYDISKIKLDNISISIEVNMYKNLGARLYICQNNEQPLS